MRAGIALVCTIILLPAVHAAATPYYIAYEANTPGSFPEDEGWERGFGFGGADRSVQDGFLTLSSTDIQVYDYYEIDMGGNLDPDPGEMFFGEWRLLVEANSDPDYADCGVTIARDSIGGPFGGGDVSFRFFTDTVVETRSGSEAVFDQGVFHVFRFESNDMDSFRFLIDGELRLTGVFDFPSVNESFVGFGDAVQGIASTSRWDYVRFGVVPEPGCALVLAAGLIVARRRRSRRARGTRTARGRGPMRAGIALVCTIILLPAVHAAATPYYIAYEADTPGVFPEDVGWERVYGFGGATRSVENGLLALSSTDIQVFDFYEIDMGGNLDPDPGEMFFAEWRLKVEYNSDLDFGDSDVAIARDSTGGPFGGGHVAFEFFEDHVEETTSGSGRIFQQGVFHTFRFESADMTQYLFYIDGELSFEGVFDTPSVNDSFVNFGDGTQGVASTAQWDYFRFGVVPEPGSALLLAVGLFLAPARRRAKAYTCKPKSEH
jgi:hypothetical protein